MGFQQVMTSTWAGIQRPLATLGRGRDHDDLRKVNSALMPLLALGLLASLCVGAGANSTCRVLMWCMSCLAVGATTGFLFGIPRAGSQPQKPTETKKEANGTPSAPASKAKEVEAGRPNTNLEEVSDWLTKILVGLSLVNLEKIEGRVRLVSQNAAAAIKVKPTESDVSVATALVVGMSVVGFLCGYLYTRLFLQGAIIRSDKEAFFTAVRDEQQKADPPTDVTQGKPVLLTQSDRQAAERVQEAAPVDRPEVVLAPLRALAAQYEQTRKEMPGFSSERTQKMLEVVTQMKPLTLVARPFIKRLSSSNSPGERLAAVLVLQMEFDPAYIEWLADRLHVESSFIGYQAASTLLARVRVAGPPEKRLIKEAVEAAQKKGVQPEEARDKLVASLLEEASK